MTNGLKVGELMISPVGLVASAAMVGIGAVGQGWSTVASQVPAASATAVAMLMRVAGSPLLV